MNNLAVAVPTQNRTGNASEGLDDMRKVEVITEIKAPPATIIAAFTDPTMLRDWWGVEQILIEKKRGGLYTLAWKISDHGLGFVSSGIIKEYKQASVLVVNNFIYLSPNKSFLGPMTLTIQVKEKGDISEFYLCQDGYQHGADWDWYYDAVHRAWPTVVQTLKEYLEKRSRERL